MKIDGLPCPYCGKITFSTTHLNEYEYDSLDEFYSHYIQMTNNNYKIKCKQGLWIEYIRCTKVN